MYLGLRISELATLVEAPGSDTVWRWKEGKRSPCGKYLRKLVMYVIDEALRRDRMATARVKALTGLTCRDCKRKMRAWEYEQLAAEAQAIEEKQQEMIEAVQRLK